jgi:hypothetical protein
MVTSLHPMESILFEKRIFGDYGVDTGIDADVAVDMINQARDFLLDARKYIEEQEQNSQE